MKLFVLGATGRTGREIVDLALDRKHHVTAFVRSPQKMSARENLHIVKGDVLDGDALTLAMTDHDAVIFALGPPGSDALRPSTFVTDVSATLVAAMTKAHVSRLVIISAAVLFPGEGLAFKFFSFILRHHARDLRSMEAIVAASDLAWTIVRPPRLVKGRDEKYQTTVNTMPPGSAISFRATGAAMLDQVEQRSNVGEIIGVSR